MLTSSSSPKPFAPVSYSTASLSNPRPSASATSSGAHPYSPRSFRKASSSSASPRHSATRSSNSSDLSTSLAPRSPKRPTADAATQYSPPDWPPTSSRSSVKKRPVSPGGQARPGQSLPRTSHSAAGAADVAPAPASPKVAHDPQSQASPAPAPPAPPAPQPPREPILRETPQTSLASARNAERKASPLAPGDASGSAAKRHRPSAKPPQILPAHFQDCPPKTLATLISGLLMDLILHNDQIQLQDNHLTRFHSRTPPGISVHDYLQRLTFHATLPSPILLSIVFYIDRLCSAFEPFTINSLTVHRFLIAAATVAAKGLMDVFWTNSTYAKVGGVSLKELALLELELLVRVEWRIIPDTDKLAEYYRGVVDRHPDFALEDVESSSDLSLEDSMETDSPAGEHSESA